jgi:putative ABC transport system permease protein
LSEIEDATRLTFTGGEKTNIKTPDGNVFVVHNVLMADSNVFDVLTTPILCGNPKEALAVSDQVAVSRKVSEFFGGPTQSLGREFTIDGDDRLYTIGAVYENIPENTSLRYEILTPMKNMPSYSLDNWIGNDRYLAFVKLVPGTDPEAIEPAMRKVQEANVDMKSLKNAGMDFKYTVSQLGNFYRNTPDVKKMNGLLLLLAFLLIFTAVMNYVLVIISTLVNRTKEIAVHKCYGASNGNLFGMVLAESFVHVLLSFGVALFLIFVFKDKIEAMFKVTMSGLFTSDTLVVIGLVCLLIFAVTVIIPTYLFVKVPVAAAFRNFNESRRAWKLVLLFVQFCASALLLALLFVVGLQYSHVATADLGYKYDRVVYSPLLKVDPDRQAALVDELRKMPIVEKASISWQLPYEGASGNNVSLPSDDELLFNVADLYFVGDDYFDLMGIKILEGSVFDKSTETNSVMVSKSFADRISEMTGWKDGVVGKSVHITGHSPTTFTYNICGVYNDIVIGSAESADNRPSVIYHNASNDWGVNPPALLLRLTEVNTSNMNLVKNKIKEFFPDRNIEVVPIKTDVLSLYEESKNFRDSVLIGGLVTLLVALIGLLGYISDEANRRSREIAIRKVNGATVKDILRMMSKDITWVALPAIAIGLIGAFYVSEQWLSQYPDKINLSLWIFLLAGVLLFVIIIVSIVVRAWNIAVENPVNRLKSE